MSEFGPAYDSDIPTGHAFQERRPVHEGDVFLRRFGFRIEHRAKGEEPVWSRLEAVGEGEEQRPKRICYTEREAHARAKEIIRERQQGTTC